jgi:hypothetical protein
VKGRSWRNHKVDVEERALSENELLGSDVTWSTKLRGVRCQIEPISSKEQAFQDRESIEVEYRMYTNTLDIDETDRIVGRGDILEDGVRYGIQGVVSWGNHLVVRLREWQ